MENQNTNLESWDDFKGDWLKAQMIKNFNDTFPVTNVASDTNPEGKDQVVLTLQIYTKKKKYSLNQANIKVCEDAGITSPLQLKGKMLKFAKIQTYSPTEKKRVDSLIIEQIRN